MNIEQNIIGTRSGDAEFESAYVPFISFANDGQKNAIENYIFMQVDEFFKKIYPAGVIRTQLSYSKLITEEDFKDFNKVKISYFYENLFHDLERGSDGKLELKIKWSITFDERCTPIQLANLHPNYRGYEHKLSSKDGKSRKYGIIEINRIPIFYYIYFTLKEILDVAKQIPKIPTF
ncbi:MAG: hypothetical protein V7L04_25700 [Nostoc sp.]|uniref:hypothetical protein n=1 Tax=Nostoc sp. TaxID=1180 RepID=UPI002FF5F061